MAVTRMTVERRATTMIMPTSEGSEMVRLERKESDSEACSGPMGGNMGAGRGAMTWMNGSVNGVSNVVDWQRACVG